MLDRSAIKRDWFSNIRADILAGIVVALALIPEAIGFSIIAGVDPRVGLYASVAIAMVSVPTRVQLVPSAPMKSLALAS